MSPGLLHLSLCAHTSTALRAPFQEPQLLPTGLKTSLQLRPDLTVGSTDIAARDTCY